MNDFHKLLITMIIGGLTYSIMSFAYMHQTFSTSGEIVVLDSRLNRVDHRIQERLRAIDEKLDYLIKRR